MASFIIEYYFIRLLGCSLAPVQSLGYGCPGSVKSKINGRDVARSRLVAIVAITIPMLMATPASAQ